MPGLELQRGRLGIYARACDPTQGAPVWQYGLETTVPGSPGNVWATVLNGDYLATSGEGLYLPRLHGHARVLLDGGQTLRLHRGLHIRQR